MTVATSLLKIIIPVGKYYETLSGTVVGAVTVRHKSWYGIVSAGPFSHVNVCVDAAQQNYLL